jgi:N6-adenosine-specific RNA methylase IME4
MNDKEKEITIRVSDPSPKATPTRHAPVSAVHMPARTTGKPVAAKAAATRTAKAAATRTAKAAATRTAKAAATRTAKAAATRTAKAAAMPAVHHQPTIGPASGSSAFSEALAAELKVDPEFRSLCRPLDAKELEELERSILDEGVRDAIVLWQGLIIDGHNRYEIASKHNLPFRVVELDLPDRESVRVWMLRNQLGRRNLSELDRIEIALALEKHLAEQAKQRMLAGKGADGSGGRGKRKASEPELAGKTGSTRDTIAEIAGVSHGTVDHAKKVLKKGVAELREAVRNGRVAISTAADIASLPKAKQEQIVKQDEKKILAAAKKIREKRAQERRKQRVERIKTIAASEGQYPVIYADPPWQCEDRVSTSGDVETRYPTMDTDEIKALTVGKLTTKDAVLLLWCPAERFADAIEVIRAWGFDYRTNIVWDNGCVGPGDYCRSKHEHLCVAVRGQAMIPPVEGRPDSLIRAPRGEHWEKPAVFYEIIERMFPKMPRIELFARKRREGWASWGDRLPTEPDLSAAAEVACAGCGVADASSRGSEDVVRECLRDESWAERADQNPSSH